MSSFGTERRGGHRAGGVVHRQQQGELGTVIAQPPVVAAVDLHQHPFLGHSLSPYPVLGWTPFARAGDAGLGQDAPHGRPAEVDALSVPEQLGEVGVVDASVPGPSQLRHVDDQRLGRGVDGSATAVAMCQSRRAAFTVGRQDAAGVAGSYFHQLGCLVQGHVLFCQAVENLKSALFFWGQCHILHDVTAMMGPGHLDQGLTLDVTGTNAFKMICRPDPRWPRQCRQPR